MEPEIPLGDAFFGETGDITYITRNPDTFEGWTGRAVRGAASLSFREEKRDRARTG